MDERSNGRPRILVVDDDDAIRRLMLAIFKSMRADVECAADGGTALALLRQQDYDAVVLDLFVPVVDGFEIIRDMKETRPALLPRTVILTAASPNALRDFEEAKLVSCVMRKPFDLPGFIEAVLSCCRASEDAAGRATGRAVTSIACDAT